MEYTVHVTAYALRQMTEIHEYIRTMLHSSENAARWLHRMEEELTSLSSMPSRIPLTEEEPWHSRGVQKCWLETMWCIFGLMTHIFMSGSPLWCMPAATNGSSWNR